MIVQVFNEMKTNSESLPNRLVFPTVTHHTLRLSLPCRRVVLSLARASSAWSEKGPELSVIVERMFS